MTSQSEQATLNRPPIPQRADRLHRFAFKLEVEARDYEEAMWMLELARETFRNRGVVAIMTPLNGSDPVPRARVGIELPRSRGRLKLRN